MNNTYQPASRSSRAIAAAVAIVTVLVLFDFVAGLGETKSDAMAQLRAVETIQVATARHDGDPGAPATP